MIYRTIVSLVMAFTPMTTFAQSALQLSGKLATAIIESNEALDTLMKLQVAAQGALAGKPVAVNTDWAKLADRYDKAARDAKSAPLPTRVSQANVIKAEELSNCSTRKGAVQKLNAYLTDLRAAQERGQVSVTKLDRQLENVRKAKQALNYLIGVHEKLMALPVVGTTFGLNWVDLNTRVSASLADLGDAFMDNKTRTERDLGVLPALIRNYEANLKLVNTLPLCPP